MILTKQAGMSLASEELIQFNESKTCTDTKYIAMQWAVIMDVAWWQQVKFVIDVDFSCYYLLFVKSWAMFLVFTVELYTIQFGAVITYNMVSFLQYTLNRYPVAHA